MLYFIIPDRDYRAYFNFSLGFFSLQQQQQQQQQQQKLEWTNKKLYKIIRTFECIFCMQRKQNRVCVCLDGRRYK
jgi:hypothetical protein